MSLQAFAHDAKVLIETNRKLGCPLGELLGAEALREQAVGLLGASGEIVEERPVSPEESQRVAEWIREAVELNPELAAKYGGGPIKTNTEG